MHPIAAVEIVSAIFVLLCFIAQIFSRKNKKDLIMNLSYSLLLIIWLLADALTYIFTTNHWTVYAINFVAYVSTNIVLMAFLVYCGLFLKQKIHLNSIYYIIPMIVLCFNALAMAIYFLSGNIIQAQGNEYVTVGSIPLPILLVYEICLIYPVVIALINSKKIGRQHLSFLIVFIMPLIVAALLLIKFNIDINAVAGSLCSTFIIAIIDRVNLTSQIKKEGILLANIENNRRMVALEDKCEILYDVNITTGNYDVFYNEGSYIDKIKDKLVKTDNFFDDVKSNSSKTVYKEDISEFNRKLNSENIKDALSLSERYEFLYRLNRGNNGYWYRLRIVYKNSNKEDIIIGVFDVNSEISSKTKDKVRRDRLINEMMNNDSLFLINLDKNTRKTYKNTSKFQKNYHDSERYTDSIKRYIDDCVVEDDKPMMYNFTSVQNLRKSLAIDNSISIEYRNYYDDVRQYYVMIYARLSDNEVLLSLNEKNTEVINNLIYEKLKKDYFAMFSIDLEKGTIQTLKNEHQVFGGAVGEIKQFDVFMRDLSNSFDGESKARFEKNSDIDYLKNKFTYQDKSSFVYKSHLSEHSEWGSVVHFVLSRNHEGIPEILIMGFSFLDKDVIEKESLQSQVKENFELIVGLADEYKALFYINLDEKTYKPYNINKKMIDFIDTFSKSLSGPELIVKYGHSKYVHPDDQKLFDVIDEEYIRQKLKRTKKFFIRYRRMVEDSYLWYEIDFIKFEDDNERANGISVGFAERDADIRKEQLFDSCFNVLNNDDNPDFAIDELLVLAEDFYGSDRAYVFEYTDDKQYLNNTYERCKEGIIPAKDQLQNIPARDFLKWVSLLAKKGSYYMKNIDNEYNTLDVIEILKKKNTESLIIAPILSGENIVGFIAVDNPTHGRKSTKLLESIAVVVYSEILKRNETDEEHVTLKKLSDTFVSVFYVDLNDDYMHCWKIDDELKDDYGGKTRYSTIVNHYLENYVNDKEIYYEYMSPNYIYNQFKNCDRFSLNATDHLLDYERNLVFDLVKVNDDGTKFVLCCRNVTDTLIKEKEQQLVLQDALNAAAEASKSKSNFLFNMSHDIRTPMNAIMGFTNMTIKHIDQTDKVINYLGKIREAGNMLLQLINSVLEMSRIESGKAILDQQPGDVYLSFKNIESTLIELALQKDIDLTFEFGEIKDKYVLCDFSRCMRIFVNVISNAIKFTPDGGRIEVSCTQVSGVIDGYAKYQYIIKDNGIGMSEEFQKHIFEQFTREESSTVNKIQGTGLGMSVVKSFVDLMQGDIQFESKQNEGTTFIITLPFKVQNDNKYTDPDTMQVVSGNYTYIPDEKVDLRGCNILLVDDSELNREIALDILTDEGINVTEAENGLEAVELVKENGPDFYDCILMDLQMPVMNGFDATREIRKLYPDAKLPIIALSANAFNEDKQAALNALMNDHISKPINIKELLSCLAKYI